MARYFVSEMNQLVNCIIVGQQPVYNKKKKLKTAQILDHNENSGNDR